MTQPLSVRLNDATIKRLGVRARRIHLPPGTLAQRYVEEGLWMDEHPLIRFADGPAGRRARLTGTGKDVWEIILVVRDNGGDAAEVPAGLAPRSTQSSSASQVKRTWPTGRLGCSPVRLAGSLGVRRFHGRALGMKA